MIPRGAAAPPPKVFCENSVYYFDFTGDYLNPGIPVVISGVGIRSSWDVQSTGGAFKATLAIRTRRAPDGTALYDIAIQKGTVNSIGFDSGTETFLIERSGNNFGIDKVQMQIKYQNSGNWTTNTASYAVTFGKAPVFGFYDYTGTEAGVNYSWLTKLFPQCMSNEVRLRSPVSECSSTLLSLAVSEVEYNYVNRSFKTVGAEFALSGDLSNQELLELRTNGGLNLISILSNASRSIAGNSFAFTSGKYYVVKLVCTDHQRWLETNKYIYINDSKWDLVLKDNNNDKGQEPIEVWTRDVFHSPDLWNRLNDPTQPVPSNYRTHEDLDYVNTPGNTNRMFFEVENIGCDPSPANEPLRLYWTRARSNESWDKDWIYDLTDHTAGGNAIETDGVLRPLGAEITIPNPVNNFYSAVSTSTNPDAFMLPAIAGGGSYIPDWADGVDWFPPNNEWYMYSATSTLSWRQADQRNIICLLAKIGETEQVRPSDDPIVWEGTPGSNYEFPNIPISEMVANNNNTNTRNTILVENSDFLVGHNNNDWDYGYGTVMVPNSNRSDRNIDLCLDLLGSGLSTDFTTYGDIYIGVTDQLWASWLANESPALTNAVVAEPGLFLATSGTHVCINDLDVSTGSEEQVGVRFLYQDDNLPSTEEYFEYSLIEIDRSEAGIPGSASVFQVTVPTSNPLLLQTKTSIERTTIEYLTGVDLSVYPNPAENSLVIGVQTEVDVPFSISIVDIHGKEVAYFEGTSIARNFSQIVDIRMYRKGVYVVELTSNGETQRKKVVVSH